MFEFRILSSDPSSNARCGIFSTPHGDFTTPCFMPCGTKGAVKTLTPDELKTLNCEILLSNTYHLMLRPGGDFLKSVGGLHKWMAWDRPILTDSGGFQVFSLATLRKITDEGVTFQSHIDGSTHHLTPEKSIELQEQIGADIIMAFDECPPGGCDYDYAEKSMKRTHDWAKRSLKAKKRTDQALFGIIQGGIYKDLRTESAKFISDLNLPGIAIGGVAVGEPKPYMQEVLETTCPLLPKDRPRYLMGIGEPSDIVMAVSQGIDMFDCVLPTRLARHGSFWTHETGRETITASKYTSGTKPIEENCNCYTCKNFVTSYLRHLIIEKEILGHRLLTIHNLHFLLNLMGEIKEAIGKNEFQKVFKKYALIQ
ncbi:MAG: tRNA guanosine(34) transglycosylase Tgt [Patescibacteria group bacterium]